nr:hypothetical protein CFP56_46955 [Quercus suber]
MGSDKIQSMILWPPKSEPEERLPLAGFTIIVSAASRNHRASTKSTTMFRLQSSLQELFRDSQLTDRNHVEILCETFPDPFRDPLSREIAPPIVTRIGVRVECNCLSLQSVPHLLSHYLFGRLTSFFFFIFPSNTLFTLSSSPTGTLHTTISTIIFSGKITRKILKNIQAPSHILFEIIVAYTEGVSDGDAMQISTVNTNLMIS